MKLTGHESFTCRYAWLPKAYRAIEADGNLFDDPENAMVLLGLGKNMVYSLRFWVEIMGIATVQADRSLAITEFGHAILEEGGHDPYLQDIRTLWLLHWKLASRKDDPLFAWDYLLYRWPYPEWSRSEMLAAFDQETYKHFGRRYATGTLKQHLTIFMNTYYPPRGKKELEDMLDCPLADLNLIEVVGASISEDVKRREPLYAFRREPKPDITQAIFEYCLDDYWRLHGIDGTLTYREIALLKGSVGQALKLPENDLHNRLDAYTRNDSERPFTYQPSAIQGLLTRRGGADKHDYLGAVYAGSMI